MINLSLENGKIIKADPKGLRSIMELQSPKFRIVNIHQQPTEFSMRGSINYNLFDIPPYFRSIPQIYRFEIEYRRISLDGYGYIDEKIIVEENSYILFTGFSLVVLDSFKELNLNVKVLTTE